MRRRQFITLLGGAAAWPLAARAQQGVLRRLGFLSLGLANDAFGKNNTGAFLQGLDTLGWREGVNLQIDWRWYGADAGLAERQAAELIARKPDVILAGGNPAVEKVRQQSKTIPVVFTLISDPVGLGYVDSLAHPGGNLTGFESYTPPIYTKELQMLTDITPPASTIAILYNPATAPYGGRMVRAMEDAAKSIGVTVRDTACRDAAEIETVMATLPRGGGQRWTIGSRRHLYPGQSRSDHLPRPQIQRSDSRQYASACRKRRTHNVRSRHPGSVSPLDNVCRSHPQGGEAGQSPGSGTDQVRTADQP
jgi:putative tryptophan/tyrosine transport system substrate-binding protein